MNLLKKPAKKEDKEKLVNQNTVSPSKILAQGMTDVKDIIAPSAIEVDFDFVRIGNYYFRTLFVSGYPRFVGANWLSPIITFEHTLDISMFCYPVESKGILDDLRRKIAEMEATITTDIERGKVVDPAVEAALEDAKALQEQLVKGIERFFQFSFYVTISAASVEELNNVTRRIESTLGSLMILSKHTTLQSEQAFQSTIPTGTDKLLITRNMDTTSLATTFPFTSSELTANEGILYGINKHNYSLIIFDRFSLENYNMVVFSKAGAGKSYFTKLEAMRSLMFGTEIIVIDPEAEYKTLCDAIGGEYINFSTTSPARINPFELSEATEEGENCLQSKILSLHRLFKIIFGEMSPREEAIIDRAFILTYKSKGITLDPTTQNNEPPLLEDLYKILLGFEEDEARGLAERLERYIKGSLAGMFDQRSNVTFKNPFTAFGIRDLEDKLRPIAMFIILDYIWTKVRKDMKRRILVVDEAWYMMQYEDSAQFLYSIAKRARKNYLGLTTITQDVEDFLNTKYGETIVHNSSIAVLLKQHPAAIDKITNIFNLSEGERHLLLSADIGEGLFFAGTNHVAMKVVASPEEHRLVTTKPSDILAEKENSFLIFKPEPTEPIQNPKPVETSQKDSSEPATPQSEPRQADTAAPTIGGTIENITENKTNPTGAEEIEKQILENLKKEEEEKENETQEQKPASRAERFATENQNRRMAV